MPSMLGDPFLEDLETPMRESLEDEEEEEAIKPLDYYAVLNVSRDVWNPSHQGNRARYQKRLQTAVHDIPSRQAYRRLKGHGRREVSSYSKGIRRHGSF